MNLDKFKTDQDRLFKALERVNNLLESYKTQPPQPIECNKWNNTHDLKYRIENRIKDLQSKYYNWHFETHGWNAY